MLVGISTTTHALPTLNQTCTVNVLNRTVQVQPDGSWTLPNVPSNMGQVRARVTCIQDGQTISGQTGFFRIIDGGNTNAGAFEFTVPDPVPTRLNIAPGGNAVLEPGASIALTVTADYAGQSSRNITLATAGVNYSSSNPAIASVDGDGLVTAAASGRALISARQDGVIAIKSITVTGSGDSDGDGLPDEFEVDNGLNPNDPIDALEDQDGDGLTALEEFTAGTGIRTADTDGDGISDGEETIAGDDGFITNPLLADTDGDGVSDDLELSANTDPTDPSSVNYGPLLTRIDIEPSNPTLTYNTVDPGASQQFTITGTLRNGQSVDLTNTNTGTHYSSGDLAIASFGAQSGQVFAGSDGNTTLTVSNGGISASTTVTVRTFRPQGLSYINIPGYANNVDTDGDIAYVAAGSAGLVVVDTGPAKDEDPATRGAMTIITRVDTPGNANDVKVAGDQVLVADGSAGLRIIDITDPGAIEEIGSLGQSGNGEAWDLAIAGTTAFVANGAAGLQIVDFSEPIHPRELTTLATFVPAQAVAVSESGTIVVVAEGEQGIELFDVSDPEAPVRVSILPLGTAREVAIRGDFAYVVSTQSGFQVVDIRDPAAPAVVFTENRLLSGDLNDIATSYRLAFGSDIAFQNLVPIFAIDDPVNATRREAASFGGIGGSAPPDLGTGIAVDSRYIYRTAGALGSNTTSSTNGSDGDTRLYLGQYRSGEDTGGKPPTITLNSPTEGAQVIAGGKLAIRVTATDDNAVASVNLYVNDQLAGTDYSYPYTFIYRVPASDSELRLRAEATDLAGSTATTTDRIIPVTSDPGMEISGSLTSSDPGVALDGVTVRCGDVTVTTDFRGQFDARGVATINGLIICEAVFINGSGGPEQVLGRSEAITPQPDGRANAGTINIEYGPLQNLGVYRYFAFAPDRRNWLNITAWVDGTNFELRDIDTGEVIETGRLNALEDRQINFIGQSGMSGVERSMVLDTSAPVHASAGLGDSMFFPAMNGNGKLVGREFDLSESRRQNQPALLGIGLTALLAFEDAEVTMLDSAGSIVQSWNVPQNSGIEILKPTFIPPGSNAPVFVPPYRFVSSGDIALMESAEYGNVVVPARNGTDVGTEFLFHAFDAGYPGIAVTGYADADVTLTRLSDGAEVWRAHVGVGEQRPHAIPPGFYRLSSTGQVSLLAGGTVFNEGESSSVYRFGGVAQHTGAGGKEFWLHPQSGARVFAFYDNTEVTVEQVPDPFGFGAETFQMGGGEYVEPFGFGLLHITSTRPIVVETRGNSGSFAGSWSTTLKYVP